jgi:hypothetical protein
MCPTDLDLDRPEIAEDEQVPSPDPRPIDVQYVGVAWGLAERQDGPDAAPVGRLAVPPRLVSGAAPAG